MLSDYFAHSVLGAIQSHLHRGNIPYINLNFIFLCFGKLPRQSNDNTNYILHTQTFLFSASAEILIHNIGFSRNLLEYKSGSAADGGGNGANSEANAEHYSHVFNEAVIYSSLECVNMCRARSICGQNECDYEIAFALGICLKLHQLRIKDFVYRVSFCEWSKFQTSSDTD